MSEENTFLDMALDEVPELRAVPGNREYQLEVVRAEIMESKGEKTAGQKLVLLRFNIMDEEDTKTVTYPIMLPDSSLSKEDNNNRKRQMKRFLQAIDFPTDRGFNVEELVGETCFAILGETDDPTYGPGNEIKSFVNAK